MLERRFTIQVWKKKRERKKEHAFNVTAFRVVQEATGQIEPEFKKPRKEYD